MLCLGTSQAGHRRVTPLDIPFHLLQDSFLAHKCYFPECACQGIQEFACLQNWHGVQRLVSGFMLPAILQLKVQHHCRGGSSLQAL